MNSYPRYRRTSKKRTWLRGIPGIPYSTRFDCGQCASEEHLDFDSEGFCFQNTSIQLLKGKHRENRLILLIFWKHLQQRFCFAAMFSPRFYRYRRRFTAFNLVSFNWFSGVGICFGSGHQTWPARDYFLCRCFFLFSWNSLHMLFHRCQRWMAASNSTACFICSFLSSRHRQFVPSHYPENWNWGASIPPTPDSHSYITWSFKHHPKKQSGVK